MTPKKGEGGGLTLPDGEIVAAIEIGEAGDPQVTYWWESRKAKFGTGTGAVAAQARERGIDVKASDALCDPEFYAGPARAAVKEEHGVSADVLETVRSMRRELLRARLVENAQRDGDVGLDHAVWSQLRVLVGRDSPRVVGAGAPSRGENMVGISATAADAARAQTEQQVAHHIWRDAIREIAAENFITGEDLAVAFAEYRRAGAATKRLAGAVLAGLTLERGANAPGFSFTTHDALAALTGGDDASLRRLWEPTEAFLALLPKSQLLAIAEPLVGPETHSRWGKVKAALLPGLLAEALAGGGNAVAACSRQAAAEWVHPLLAFREIDLTPPAPAAQVVEAAA
ncbi:hypothetical protein [Sphingomonas solaris]|uniref:Uncharacterized protein n=1 Tax=Alterirhizorhabdus solaris TaxID=2529389 RepID=A0A558R7L1_9SPHN|nr:hypothetical protein [Sphingomonas solaris]TVV75308.1 hypothetical protein FOY91_07625 [Sphingomonas solaris]